MDKATLQLRKTIKNKGIAIAAIERNTSISKTALYNSLGEAETSCRPLRATELLEICAFVGVNPMELLNPDDAS